jgi:hypothetical protein
VSDSATAVPAKDTHASVLLSVFSSASALHRTAATRKFPHCCVYSPRWSGAEGEAALQCVLASSSSPWRWARSRRQTAPSCQTKLSDVLWCRRCEARPSGTISQSPRAFSDSSRVETLAIAGSMEERADPGLSGLARCLLQSHSQAHAPGIDPCRVPPRVRAPSAFIATTLALFVHPAGRNRPGCRPCQPHALRLFPRHRGPLRTAARLAGDQPGGL